MNTHTQFKFIFIELHIHRPAAAGVDVFSGPRGSKYQRPTPGLSRVQILWEGSTKPSNILVHRWSRNGNDYLILMSLSQLWGDIY